MSSKQRQKRKSKLCRWCRNNPFHTNGGKDKKGNVPCQVADSEKRGDCGFYMGVPLILRQTLGQNRIASTANK